MIPKKLEKRISNLLLAMRSQVEHGDTEQNNAYYTRLYEAIDEGIQIDRDDMRDKYYGIKGYNKVEPNILETGYTKEIKAFMLDWYVPLVDSILDDKRYK